MLGVLQLEVAARGRTMFKFAIATILAALTLSVNAHAAVSFTSTPFDSGVPTGQILADDFDNPIAAGYQFAFANGGALMDRSVSGLAAAPAGDTSMFAVAWQGVTATFTSDRVLRSASVYLGSIDAYNTITFLDKGVVVAAFSGAQLVANPNGDQQSGAMNRLFDFNFGGQAVDQIAFSSSGNSFEFDNIAVAPAPEPQTWILLIVGIGLMGLALRRAGRLPARDLAPAISL